MTSYRTSLRGCRLHLDVRVIELGLSIVRRHQILEARRRPLLRSCWPLTRHLGSFGCFVNLLADDPYL